MKPCKECPFSITNPARSQTSEYLVVFIGKVCEDEGQLCHMVEDSECVGARHFFEGGHTDVFPSLIEMVKARDPETLATEFFTELERLQWTD